MGSPHTAGEWPDCSYWIATQSGVDEGPTMVAGMCSLVQGGGGELRGGIILPWDISQRVYFACNLEFAVGNFAPTCCEPTFGWCWLLLLTDALQLSPRGLLFLPDELLVAGCCYFMVVVVISWWLLVFSRCIAVTVPPLQGTILCT